MTDIQAKIAAALSPKRYAHVLRVVDYATHLAKRYDVDVEQARLAALIHDYAKERSDADFLAVIAAKHLDADLVNWGNNIWHGIVGAEMMRDELGVTDEAVLQAVREHTTGAGATMTPLSQVLFMADYLEAGRDFPGVDTARELTDQNLQAGVKYQITHTLRYLLQKEVPIHPLALTTYNYWGTRNWE